MPNFIGFLLIAVSLTSCASSERKTTAAAIIAKCNDQINDQNAALCAIYDRKASERYLAKKRAEFNRNLAAAISEVKANPEKYKLSRPGLLCTGTNYGGSGFITMTCN